MGLGEAGGDVQRLSIVLDGLMGRAEIKRYIAQGEIGFSMVGLDLNHLSIGRDRLLEAALSGQDASQNIIQREIVGKIPQQFPGPGLGPGQITRPAEAHEGFDAAGRWLGRRIRLIHGLYPNGRRAGYRSPAVRRNA